MDVLFDGGVEVEYGFMYFQPEWQDVDMVRARGGQSNGLCGAAYPGVLVTATGLHTGTVPLRVEFHAQPPPIDDGWQDVVEVSLTTPSASYIVIAADWVTTIAMPPPGTYRARWCATGMDQAASAGVDVVGGERARDRYLLQLWPSTASPDAVVRQGSRQAASWHALAAQTPPPPSTPAGVVELALEAERRRQAPWEAVRVEHEARVARLRNGRRRGDRPLGGPERAPGLVGPGHPTTATYREAKVDLHTVVALHGFADERAPHPPNKYGELIAPGVVHIDYGDPDRVYRITVEEVPRRHLRMPLIAVPVDGIDVRVTGVVVDTHVSVRLEGIGPAAKQAADDHRRHLARWSADQRATRERQAPPPWPAQRLKTTVAVHVTDDVGTVYDFASSEFGGEDSPWVDLRRYLPSPPPNATALRLRLVVAGRPDVEDDVPLSQA